MRRIANLPAFAGALLCCALLFAQVPPSAPDVPGNHTADISQIIVGVSNVQSGPSRSLGQNLLRGSAAYFDFVNERGGVYGRKISIRLKDDKYEPDPAILNTDELI